MCQFPPFSLRGPCPSCFQEPPCRHSPFFSACLFNYCFPFLLYALPSLKISRSFLCTLSKLLSAYSLLPFFFSSRTLLLRKICAFSLPIGHPNVQSCQFSFPDLLGVLIPFVFFPYRALSQCFFLLLELRLSLMFWIARPSPPSAFSR